MRKPKPFIHLFVSTLIYASTSTHSSSDVWPVWFFITFRSVCSGRLSCRRRLQNTIVGTWHSLIMRRSDLCRKKKNSARPPHSHTWIMSEINKTLGRIFAGERPFWKGKNWKFDRQQKFVPWKMSQCSSVYRQVWSSASSIGLSAVFHPRNWCILQSKAKEKIHLKKLILELVIRSWHFFVEWWSIKIEI